MCITCRGHERPGDHLSMRDTNRSGWEDSASKNDSRLTMWVNELLSVLEQAQGSPKHFFSLPWEGENLVPFSWPWWDCAWFVHAVGIVWWGVIRWLYRQRRHVEVGETPPEAALIVRLRRSTSRQRVRTTIRERVTGTRLGRKRSRTTARIEGARGLMARTTHLDTRASPHHFLMGFGVDFSLR
jgi:hypothetical protein